MWSFPVSGPWWSFKGNAVIWRSQHNSRKEMQYVTTCSDSGIFLALVSTPLGSARLSAQPKTLADYDLKALAIVVNRDSSDITVIDPATDTIIKRIPLGEYTNA